MPIQVKDDFSVFVLTYSENDGMVLEFCSSFPTEREAVEEVTRCAEDNAHRSYAVLPLKWVREVR